MSLDVYLLADEPAPVVKGSGIFIRENGATKEITREEWDALYHVEPMIYTPEETEGREVYSRSITHNLGKMASAAGLYKALWRPEEIGITKAEQLIAPLSDGLGVLRADPERFKALNPPNGWGNYEALVEFVAAYLAACRRSPNATVRVSR